MIKILFVCHGNICRSVASEYVFNDMISKLGLEDEFYVDSAAATNDEIGNPIYPPMKKVLDNHDVKIGNHRARLITSLDLDIFDYILIMDKENDSDLKYMFSNNDNLSKVKFLKSFSGDKSGNQISDPWYTRDFETTYQDIKKSLEGFIKFLGFNKKYF